MNEVVNMLEKMQNLNITIDSNTAAEIADKIMKYLWFRMVAPYVFFGGLTVLTVVTIIIYDIYISKHKEKSN